MSKMKEVELLNHLADLYTLYFAILFDPRPEVQEFLIDDNQPERQEYIDELEKGKKQAYQQIKEMIQKQEGLPQKRALTVDEIISKYPMSVRILLVQLVEQVERLEKKKPKVTEEWILEWERRLAHYALGLTTKEANLEIRTMLKEVGVEIVERGALPIHWDFPPSRKWLTWLKT